MDAYQRQASYYSQPPPSPRQAPQNTLHPNMPAAPVHAHSDFGASPLRMRVRSHSQSSQHSQLSAPFLASQNSGHPIGDPAAPTSVPMPPNQWNGHSQPQPLPPGRYRGYSHGHAGGYAHGNTLAVPSATPLYQPHGTSAPMMQRRDSYDSHHSDHSHHSRYHHHDEDDEDFHGRHRGHERSRPTLGDSMMMVVDSVRGLFSSRRV